MADTESTAYMIGYIIGFFIGTGLISFILTWVFKLFAKTKFGLIMACFASLTLILIMHILSIFGTKNFEPDQIMIKLFIPIIVQVLIYNIFKKKYTKDA